MSSPGASPRAKSLTQAEDLEAIRQAADGDHAALGRLYDRYAPVLVAVGMRILKDRRETEDLLHDVFVEVWKKANTYDQKRGSVRVWLCMRMRSRALDRIRSAGRVSNVPMEEAKLPDERRVGEDPSLASDRIAVRDAMATLPQEQRTVLELGYFGGLSSSEIAKRLEIPIGTVKSRVAAALKKLRVHLSDHPETAGVA